MTRRSFKPLPDVDPADFELLWQPSHQRWSTTLRAVSFCPACGVLHVGQVNGVCMRCSHPLWQLPYSPERMAAFRIGGSAAIRALDEHHTLVPSDTLLAHRGGWRMCVCRPCADRRMIELAP